MYNVTVVKFETMGFGAREFGNLQPIEFSDVSKALAWLKSNGYRPTDAVGSYPHKWAKLSESARVSGGMILSELYIGTVSNDTVVYILVDDAEEPAANADGKIERWLDKESAQSAANCMKELAGRFGHTTSYRVERMYNADVYEMES